MTNITNDSDAKKELELGISLEGVFLPHIRKQRDKAHKRQPGANAAQPSGMQLRCAHYTSADAALKIIKSKRIWMRNATCMSDYREVQHGYSILLKFFSDAQKKQSFISAFDACAPGAAAEAISPFDQWWQNIQRSTYIASMSEHDSSEDLHGRFSMWRAFGGVAARVAIVFKIPWISPGARSLKLLFSPIAYLAENEVHAELQRVIENIKNDCEFLRSVERRTIVGWVFTLLLSNVTCIKHEGFREEREWRAIYSPQRTPSDLMLSSTEVIGGVPQLVYMLPIDAATNPLLADLDLAAMFDRLIIGPSPYPSVMYEAFVTALTNAGVSEAGKHVFISNIPIRS
jgi:hypothetical protein